MPEKKKKKKKHRRNDVHNHVMMRELWRWDIRFFLIQTCARFDSIPFWVQTGKVLDDDKKMIKLILFYKYESNVNKIIDVQSENQNSQRTGSVGYREKS